jgi:pimeloyl-ACP methyl ester carboxylesterase
MPETAMCTLPIRCGATVTSTWYSSPDSSRTSSCSGSCRPPAATSTGSALARVIFFDRRGTGLSDPFTVETAPDLETRVEDLAAVMNAAGSARAALCGWSEGGPTAILFAATHPERTQGLVLHGTMARTTYAEDHPWLPRVEAFIEAGIELLQPAWGRGVAIDVSAPSMADQPEVVAFYGRLERTSITPGMLASVAAMFYDTDVRAVLPAVRVPTLVEHRLGDRLVNVRSGRYLAEHIEGARMVEVPGRDHVPFFQHPEIFLDEIEEFLTGSRTVAVPERRLATVLFSDIVGSTERAADAGDAHWHDLLDLHHRVVRTELARFDGNAVKTLGDGFLATFDGPAAAIRGAAALRDATAATTYRCVSACTAARSRSWATTSAGSPYTSRHGSRPSREPARCS